MVVIAIRGSMHWADSRTRSKREAGYMSSFVVGAMRPGKFHMSSVVACLTWFCRGCSPMLIGAMCRAIGSGRDARRGEKTSVDAIIKFAIHSSTRDIRSVLRTSKLS